MNFRLQRRRLLLQAACAYLGAASPAARLLAEVGAAASDDELNLFLVTLLQRLFPHDQLDHSMYVDVADAMAGAVTSDPELLSLVQAGRRKLDQKNVGPWQELDADDQVHQLSVIEETPFFQTLRGLGNFLFYNHRDLWSFFGYEGSSFEKGGYINRGFDDLDWLPEPEQ
jgi:hypothetical protein